MNNYFILSTSLADTNGFSRSASNYGAQWLVTPYKYNSLFKKEGDEIKALGAHNLWIATINSVDLRG